MSGPLKSDSSCVPSSQESTTKAPAARPGVLAGCRVLLVEDALDNQLLLSLILRRAGALVSLAENGQIALDLIARTDAAGPPFDVILMDIQMPVVDGYTATRALRARGDHRPIIAVTAHALDDDRYQCLAAGCDDYATKPVNRERLVALVHEFWHGMRPLGLQMPSVAPRPPLVAQ